MYAMPSTNPANVKQSMIGYQQMLTTDAYHLMNSILTILHVSRNNNYNNKRGSLFCYSSFPLSPSTHIDSKDDLFDGLNMEQTIMM